MTAPLGHIGRYELLSRLAAGGMGEVFLARATGAGGFEKQVVIKRILPHLAADPDFVRRFIAEGKLVVRLRHAGIAQVLDMGEQDGVTFIAMEHVDGRDLAELNRLSRAVDRPLPLPLLVTVVVKLLEALDYAHHVTDEHGRPIGLIHRDVSPANVMISRAGEVKLLDFGIARVTEQLHATTTGAIRGKYSYMSPQQAAGAELDLRSDLFSVGVLIWELIAGTRPFDGTSDLLTLDRIRFYDPGSLARAVPEVPQAIVDVVDRLLAKDPDDRFATADAAHRALQAWLHREQHVVAARDIAAWVESVLGAVPAPVLARPGAAFSLDEALLLGLGPGSDGIPRTATAPPTPAGAAPSRPPPSAAPPSPGSAAAPSDPAAERPATSPRPLPGSTPFVPAVGGTDTSLSAVAPRRGRGPFLALVALNLTLIGAVLWLVLHDPSEPSEPPDPTSPALSALTETPLDDGSVLATKAPPEAPPDALVTAPDPAPDALEAALPAPPPARAPVTAGRAAGALFAALGDRLLAEDAAVTLRGPAGSQIQVTGYGVGPSPRRISARPGTALRGRVTLDGHHPRTFEVVLGDEDAVNLPLRTIPTGEVTFRYFPATAEVFIDGAPVRSGAGNVVTHALPVGPHRLELIGPDGRKLSRRFDVEEGKTTNLRTLDVGRDH